MCEFCTKHGDGVVWYKNAANYAADLLADIERRTYIREFLEATIGDGIKSLGRLEAIYQKKKKLPDRLVTAMVAKAKREHFGQVVPIEDIRTLTAKAATIVRMPCPCRWAAEGIEKRCCYALSYTPETWYQDLDFSYFGKAPDEGLEAVDDREAIRQMEALEEEGAVHTIWTMVTPFVGAICNCTGRECLGLRTLDMEVETLFRAEYLACVDSELCNGCGLCQDACRFGAISGQQGDAGKTVCRIDPRKCYGCGLCRNRCVRKAIKLIERNSFQDHE